MTRPAGKAKVLTQSQIDQVFDVITHHRYPEKNRALLLLSLSLGLTARELALLCIDDIVLNGSTNSINGMSYGSVRVRPNSDMHTNNLGDKQWGYNLALHDLEEIVTRVAIDASAGKSIVPSTYFPIRKRYRKRTRIVPIINPQLALALQNYQEMRVSSQKPDRITKAELGMQPFFITQKRGPYSPNTLQEHIRLMYVEWAGIKGGTSFSGRATLIHRLRTMGITMKEVQHFIGHSSSGVTVLHEAPNVNQEKAVLQSHGSVECSDILKRFPLVNN